MIGTFFTCLFIALGVAVVLGCVGELVGQIYDDYRRHHP